MKHTLGQAARLVNKPKSTISRDLRGKLSGEKQEDGSYQIDESELRRVYPEAFDETGQPNAHSNTEEVAETPTESMELRLEVERLRERLTQTIEERSRERQQLKEQIEDLRRRADNDSEERRKLTAILTDQRQAVLIKEAPTAAQISPPVGFFRRLMGK